MSTLKDIILNYDFQSISFNAQDDIIDHKHISLDHKWLTLSESDDHFDEFLAPKLKKSLAHTAVHDYIHDHFWLMQKVKQHIGNFMEASGLGFQQLSLNILEILRMGSHGMFVNDVMM